MKEIEREESRSFDLDKATVVGRGSKTGRRFTLQTLRVALGRTQSDVARSAGMVQAEVSQLESRADVKLSTLARYAAALGGGVDVAIVVGGRRYRVEIGSGAG